MRTARLCGTAALGGAEAAARREHRRGRRCHKVLLHALSVLVLALAAAAGGCGYSSESLYRNDVRTVCVPIFASKEFRRELEFDLTKAVVKTIEDRTPYKVVHDRNRADTELRGEIIHLVTPVFSENLQTHSAQDTQVILACWYEWKDLRTGKVLARKEYVAADCSYAVAVGQDLDSATVEAVRRLAQKVVEGMETDF